MKDYREKLERYRNLSMGDEERAEFEKELEQYAALFEYFLDEEMPASEPMEKIEPMTFDSAENKKVKKKVSRRMLKLVVMMIAAVTVIVGGGMYLIPKAIDSYYYNPMEGQSELATSPFFGPINYAPGNFELYHRIESQIDMNRERLESVSATQLGPAKYQVIGTRVNDFTGLESPVSVTIDRGRVDSTFHERPRSGTLAIAGMMLSDMFTQSGGNQDGAPFTDSYFDKTLNLVEKLPDSAWINVSMTFANAMSREELKSFVEAHPEIQFLSTKFALSASVDYYDPGWGIRLIKPLIYPQNYGTEFKNKIEETYPSLLDSNSISLNSTDEKILEFLRSNLQYLADHQEDNIDPIVEYEEGMGPVNSEDEDLKNAIESLEEGELAFRSVNVAVPRAQFESFVKDETFYYMELKDISLVAINFEAFYAPSGSFVAEN